MLLTMNEVSKNSKALREFTLQLTVRNSPSSLLCPPLQHDPLSLGILFLLQIPTIWMRQKVQEVG